jgi:serine/threonine-protein kinase
MIGKTVSHYKILEKLGEGGMGVVYKAEDTKLKRPVALKFLPTQLTTDREMVKRFEREAQAAAGLNHPNIITIYEIGEHEDRVFICMEYVDGRTIREHMAGNPLPLDRALGIVSQITEGLGKAHKAGIVHRDLKPDNILVDTDGRVKIVDFGLAKLRGATQLTKEGSTLGTVAYMSPEQVRALDVDHRADIWALGVILYEMITGRRPFGSDYVDAVQYAIVNEQPEPITGIRTGVPIKLEEHIGKAMAKPADERYQHVEDFAVDLRTVERELESVVSSAVAPAARTGRKRGPALYIGIAVALIAAVIVWNHFSGKPVVASDSIAVLPLENLGDPEQEYFTDGMTEALIAGLAQVRALKVISRTSVMKYKETDKSLRQIADELGVSTIIEGSVLWAGDRVRITAQLIDAATDKHLWAQSYDRDLSDVLALQSDVARAITDEIRVKLTPQEEERLSQTAKVDPEAYRLYLQGRFYWNKRTREGLHKSLEYFEQAIDIDPNYALAYAGMADAYLVLADWGFVASTEGYLEGKRLGLKVLEIDPSLAQAINVLAYVHYSYDWDWDRAESGFKRALEINPNYATAHQWYAEFLDAMGRYDEALTQIRIAEELDPLSPIITFMHSAVLFDARQYDRALETMERVLEMDPGFAAAWANLGRALLYVGRDREAVDAYVKAWRMVGWDENDIQSIVDAFDESGVEGFCRKRAEMGEALVKDRYVTPLDSYHGVAEGYAFIGDTDRAMYWLRQYYDDHGSRLVTLNVNPFFDNLRSDPRFIELLEKIGFERVSE